MNSRQFLELARRLVRVPTAPYHEHGVRAVVEEICAENGLEFERDAFGNLLVKLQTNHGQRPFVLAAHMDHPGFEIVRKLSGNRWLARFQGGVGDSYFRVGIPIRLMPGGVPGKLGLRRGKDKIFQVDAAHSAEDPFKFAVWELEDFAVRHGIIHARGCDDVVGVAAILATMIELKRGRSRVNVIGAISRAEEIGFRGALMLAMKSGIPKSSLVVSLETSKELPGVKMGRGVILRVGDRTSVFDSDGMRFLAETANALSKKRKSFQFQRGLMSGGTCEATAYQEFGYQTTAVCIALGNYHNCGEANRIKAEYVSVSDACSMVDLLVAAAKEMRNYKKLTARLRARLKQMGHEADAKLRRTAGVP
jgi:putative aminopeptidase FrvX